MILHQVDGNCGYSSYLFDYAPARFSHLEEPEGFGLWGLSGPLQQQRNSQRRQRWVRSGFCTTSGESGALATRWLCRGKSDPQKDGVNKRGADFQSKNESPRQAKNETANGETINQARRRLVSHRPKHPRSAVVSGFSCGYSGAKVARRRECGGVSGWLWEQSYLLRKRFPI